MKWYTETRTITYTDLNGASSSTTATMNLFPKFYDSYPMFLLARVKTAFTGTKHGVNDPTVKVGDGTTTDCYLKDQPINRIADLIPGQVPNSQGFCEAMFMESRTGSFASTSQGKLEATFTSASGNFGSLTAGEIEFVYGYLE